VRAASLGEKLSNGKKPGGLPGRGDQINSGPGKDADMKALLRFAFRTPCSFDVGPMDRQAWRTTHDPRLNT
jgi:hypothetical protein